MTPAPAAKSLGKLPAKGSVKQLLFARFVPERADRPPPPKVWDFWARRAPFPARTYGNRDNGCCTRASQANLATRMERIETRATPAIADDEVLRVYYAMTARLYGGGDVGAYETDALDEWRRADLTFRDAKSRPLTIDAYTRVNPLDQDEVRYALWLGGAKGIKLCLNLPAAWQRADPPAVWDIPDDGNLTGEWAPGSWGGHSLTSDAFSVAGPRLVHTWYEGGAPCRQTITWRAFAAYCDEAYSVVDSIDGWRKLHGAAFDTAGLAAAVNEVSPVKVKV